MLKSETKPDLFILDVDGVLSTGQFIYDSSGKKYKIFGSHDSEGLNILSEFIKIEFISADKRGFEISNKRVSDMGFKLNLVSEEDRRNHLEKLGFENVIFMGDGYYDALLFSEVNYSIAPANARKEALENADYVTENKAGEGAVMDACIHLNEKFYIK